MHVLNKRHRHEPVPAMSRPPNAVSAPVFSQKVCGFTHRPNNVISVQGTVVGGCQGNVLVRSVQTGPDELGHAPINNNEVFLSIRLDTWGWARESRGHHTRGLEGAVRANQCGSTDLFSPGPRPYFGMNLCILPASETQPEQHLLAMGPFLHSSPLPPPHTHENHVTHQSLYSQTRLSLRPWNVQAR